MATFRSRTPLTGRPERIVRVGPKLKELSRAALVGWLLAAWVQSASAQVPLGGNVNYIFSGDCKPIIGLSVTVTAKDEIVGPEGLGVQLNADSPPPPPGTPPSSGPAVMQQYMSGIGVNPAFNWAIQNFAVKGRLFAGNDTELLPMGNSVNWPRGYSVTISLTNDAKGRITGEDVTIKNGRGVVLKRANVALSSIQGFTDADLAPIYAFQLNLVGPVGGQVLSQGTGTIMYSATSKLAAGTQYPSCSVHVGTQETANTSYGRLPTRPATRFTQTFEIIAPKPAPTRIAHGACPSSCVPGCYPFRPGQTIGICRTQQRP